MASGELGSEQGLVRYLQALRRRKGILIIVVAAIVGPALAVSLLQTPRYTAVAKVLVQPSSREALFDSDGNLQVADPHRTLQTQVEIFASRPVKQAVRRTIGSAPRVSVVPVVDTDVIRVEAEDERPRRAASIADAYATAYIDVRRQQAVDDTRAAIDQIGAKIGQLAQQIYELDQQIAAAPPDQRPTMTPQRDALLAQQSLFSQRFDQLQVEVALQTGGARLVSPAEVPTSQSSPKPLRTGLLALVAGLVLGSAIALIVDHLDDSVKTKDDLERVAPAIPVIGLIPAPAGASAAKAEVESVTRPTSVTAEAYRTLRTSIQFLSLEHTMRTLQITSPSAQEGKTTTLANLGVALARAGQSVVIVGCDLRRPRIHEFFGIDNSAGFTSVLLGTVPLSMALKPVPGEDRLYLLASGPLPPNPSELLSSQRTDEVFNALKEEIDVVLIDCPPVLPVTDALILARRVDATLLACVAGVTTRKQMARAVELLEQVDAPLVGTVLNGVKGEAALSGYGYYGYGAAPEPTGEPAPGDVEAAPGETTTPVP